MVERGDGMTWPQVTGSHLTPNSVSTKSWKSDRLIAFEHVFGFGAYFKVTGFSLAIIRLRMQPVHITLTIIACSHRLGLREYSVEPVFDFETVIGAFHAGMLQYAPLQKFRMGTPWPVSQLCRLDNMCYSCSNEFQVHSAV